MKKAIIGLVNIFDTMLGEVGSIKPIKGKGTEVTQFVGKIGSTRGAIINNSTRYQQKNQRQKRKLIRQMNGYSK